MRFSLLWGDQKNDFTIFYFVTNMSNKNMFNNRFSKRRNYSKVLHKFPTQPRRKLKIRHPLVNQKNYAFQCDLPMVPKKCQNQHTFIKLEPAYSPEIHENLQETRYENLLWNPYGASPLEGCHPSYDIFSARSDYADLLSDISESLFRGMRNYNEYTLNITNNLFRWNPYGARPLEGSHPSHDYIKITREDNRHNTQTYANFLIDSLENFFEDIKRYEKHMVTILFCRKYNRALNAIDKFLFRHYIVPQSFDVQYLREHNFLDLYKAISQRYFDRARQVTYALMESWPLSSTGLHYFHSNQQDVYRMEYRLTDSLNCQNIFKTLWYRRVLCKLKSCEKLLDL